MQTQFLFLALGAAGLTLGTDLSLGEAALVGFAFSFSSTVFAVKALDERNEATSLHGRIAIGILVWAIGRYPDALGAGNIALYCVLLAMGCFLNYAMNMLFMIPVFWMHNAAGLRDTFWGLGRFSGRPDGIYTGWVRRILTSILPFAIIISFPTRALFGDQMLEITMHMSLVVAVAFALLVITWRFGLRAYASASS